MKELCWENLENDKTTTYADSTMVVQYQGNGDKRKNGLDLLRCT